MRTWSKTSQIIHDQLHERLQVLVTRIRDEVTDITLIYPHGGHRDRETQNAMFENSKSKVRYPDSKHNRRPSQAIDLQPYPYPKLNVKVWGALGYIAGHAHRIAAEEGFSIRWGGDWDGDGDMTDQTFDDLFHLELIDEKTDSSDATTDGDDNDS